MNTEENNILKTSDFEPLEAVPVSSKFIELVYCKKHVQLTSQRRMDPLRLAAEYWRERQPGLSGDQALLSVLRRLVAGIQPAVHCHLYRGNGAYRTGHRGR